MEERFLRGSCTCGRNRYVIEVPSETAFSQTNIFLDNSSASRRTHASPLTAFLRVPLDWLHSSTHAFYPDENHSSIRRTYTTPLVPGTRRQFCGYCGTQLSSWSERSLDDADFICLTLGSLLDEDVAILNRMGLLPGADEENVGRDRDDGHIDSHLDVSVGSGDNREGNNNGTGTFIRGGPPSYRHVWTRGSPWFEEMIEDSGLTRARRRKGGDLFEGGTTRIEVEILEIDHDGSSDASSGPGRTKRKFGEESEGKGNYAAKDGGYVMSGALQEE